MVTIIFLETRLSLLFLPKADLLNNLVIFSIKVNRVTILLKP